MIWKPQPYGIKAGTSFYLKHQVIESGDNLASSFMLLRFKADVMLLPWACIFVVKFLSHSYGSTLVSTVHLNIAANNGKGKKRHQVQCNIKMHSVI